MYKRHDVAPLGPKSGRAQYGKIQRGGEDGKGQRSREDGKGKRGGEDGKGEKGGGGHRRNKVNPVVEENSGCVFNNCINLNFYIFFYFTIYISFIEFYLAI